MPEENEVEQTDVPVEETSSDVPEETSEDGGSEEESD